MHNACPRQSEFGVRSAEFGVTTTPHSEFRIPHSLVPLSLLEVPQDRIHEGAVPVTRSGMGHKPCGLVDEEKMVVFIRHVERDRLRGKRDTGGTRWQLIKSGAHNIAE